MKQIGLAVSGLVSVLAVGSMMACVAEMKSDANDSEDATGTSRQAAEVPATAATVSGSCARLEEVGMEFPDYANFKVAGGWTSFNTSGNGVRSWSAQARTGCATYASSGSTYKNKVICYYDTETHGSWEGPQLGASKTFPTQYECSCVSSTGKYTCIRQ